MANLDIDPNEHPVRANRGIVIVVVTLGALIVLGLGGLVYGIAMKAGKLGDSEPAASLEVAPEHAVVRSELRRGSDVRGLMSMTAAGDRLYLHIRRDDGQEVVRAYDAMGALIYEISLD